VLFGAFGKVDPDRLPDAIVCYGDSTITLPLITHYALAKKDKKPLKKLYFKRKELFEKMKKEYFAHNKTRLKIT
ncbi:MAG: hypothetical protein M1501_04205, partial [Candidatus Omnitrophica bacterium]|nr:hypothetical protein [Candidatus Omnitrophota bacterium]